MTVVVITPPEPVVTFEEVSKHLADVPAEDQSYVEGLTAAATAWIDGPAGWLGRSIGVQELELRHENLCSPIISLPYGPVLEIVGAWSGEDILPVDQYVPGARAITFGMLLPRGAPLRIRYWAGYGHRVGEPPAWANTAPPPIKVAIMMLVAQWYHNRSSVSIGAAPGDLPFAVDALLQPYRVYR